VVVRYRAKGEAAIGLVAFWTKLLVSVASSAPHSSGNLPPLYDFVTETEKFCFSQYLIRNCIKDVTQKHFLYHLP
jgi:hypothetical protein